jgi:putative membrane protein
MAQQKESNSEISADQTGTITASKRRLTSKRVTDHLANERTFLAWMRTGLATITFGFVVERFGLLLRELGLKNAPIPLSNVHYSSAIGVALTILGVLLIVVALINFLRIRQAIDKEDFHPPVAFAVILSILASLIGIILAFYLLTTG